LYFWCLLILVVINMNFITRLVFHYILDIVLKCKMFWLKVLFVLSSNRTTEWEQLLPNNKMWYPYIGHGTTDNNFTTVTKNKTILSHACGKLPRNMCTKNWKTQIPRKLIYSAIQHHRLGTPCWIEKN
jgi:hypothetical protein